MEGESAVSFHDVELLGFRFQSLRSRPGAFTVTKNLASDSGKDAMGAFNKSLFPLLDAISLHRLGPVSAYGASVTIARVREKIAIANLWEKEPGVAMSLTGGETQAPTRNEIEQIAKQGGPALELFQQALLAETGLSKTIALLLTAEALAGTKRQPFNCRGCKKTLICSQCSNKHEAEMSDKAMLKGILGEAFDYYYAPRQDGEAALRNQLMHGVSVDEVELSAKMPDLIEGVKGGLKKHFSITEMPNLKGVRDMHTRRGYQGALLRYKDELPLPFEVFKLMRDGRVQRGDDIELADAEEVKELLGGEF